jgi:hypothetical protein
MKRVDPMRPRVLQRVNDLNSDSRVSPVLRVFVRAGLRLERRRAKEVVFELSNGFLGFS